MPEKAHKEYADLYIDLNREITYSRLHSRCDTSLISTIDIGQNIYIFFR